MSWPTDPMHWVTASLAGPGSHPANGGTITRDSRWPATNSATGAGM